MLVWFRCEEASGRMVWIESPCGITSLVQHVVDLLLAARNL